MRRSFIQTLLVIFVLCHTQQACFGQSQDHAPTAPSPATHKQRGFFDYVLDKVNPNGNDYGAAMHTGRDSMVEHSIDDLYFWSNVVTLLLLTGAVAVVFLQWRSADKKEVIAAALITELWNGRVSDRIEIDRRTEQFNRLVETHNADVERALMLKPSTSETASESNGSLSKNVQKMTAKGAGKTSSGDPTQLRLQIGETFQPSATQSADAQQENVLLQRRLEAFQNSEQNLKQRLNQMTLLLDQERRRNASLKGA